MKITVKPEVFQKLHQKFTAAFILATDIDNRSKTKKLVPSPERDGKDGVDDVQ